MRRCACSAIEETFATISELFDLDGLEGVLLGQGFFGDLVGEVRVDVADVRLRLQLRFVGWVNLTSEQPLPVNGLEEYVTLHLLHCQAVVRVALEQASEQGRSVGAESRHDLDVLLRDLAEDLVT